MDQFSRTELVLGAATVAHLKTCRVAIFGVGGVGGYAAEALVRSGVGAIDLYDDDRVCLTNLNRQLIATRKTVGQYKVDAMEQRLHDINPNVEIHTYKMFYMPDTADQVDLTQYDYVVDAVDTVTAKLELVCRAKRAGVRIISAMGAGNNSIHPASAWPISKRRASAPSRASCAPSFASVKFASSRSSFPMNSPSSPTTTPH